MEYINKAVSADTNRYNLVSAYYGNNELVATDGYRLHYKPHLAPSDKTYFLDPGIPADTEYPDISMVLSQVNKVPQSRVDVQLNREELKELKGLVSMFGRKREIIAKLSFNHVFEANKKPLYLMTIKIKQGGLEVLWSKVMACEVPVFSDSYNLRYLVEAMDYTIGRWNVANFTISFFGILSPLKIEHVDNCAAIVMPCKDI